MSDHGSEKKKKNKNKRYDDAYLRDPEPPETQADLPIRTEPPFSGIAAAKEPATSRRYKIYLNDGKSLEIEADSVEVRKGSGLVTFIAKDEVTHVFSPHYFMYLERLS